jgi:glycosyltransferase involved in cell wall biosynthesis
VRILLLAPHPFFQQRGTPIAERMLLEVLAGHGHQIDVLTFHEGEDVQIPGCRIRRIPALPFVRSIRGIQPGFSLKKLASDAVMFLSCLSMVRRGRYDVVHAVEESAFMGLAARWIFHVPYVYDMDSGLARQMIDKFPFLNRVRRMLERFERAAVRGSVGTLAVCRSLEDHARACRPDGLVARIEDVSLLAGQGEEVDDLPAGDAPTAMYVGNLQRYQGIDLLLEAFRHTVSELPEALLVVIGGSSGDDESIAHYRRRSEELGIAAAVRFLGPRPVERLGAYLRRATVLVSPRIQGENTPMKVYSYLDSGRPVLATRLPTHTQVLTDDVARLVEPEPEPMGRALAELLRDRNLQDRLAAAARDLTQKEFTPQAFEGKLLRFYDSIEERIREERRNGETARLQAGHQGHR